MRLVRGDDRGTLVQFMQELNSVEFAFQPDRDLSIEAADDHLAYLEAGMASSEGFATAAERGGKLVGFLMAVLDSEDGSYVLPEARTFGYITDIFVTQQARGSGVGQALLRDAEARFRAKGLARARITTLAANKVALMRYEGAGYCPLEVTLVKEL